MNTRFVAFAVAATLGLGSISAFAQDHHRDGRRDGGWQHQRADQQRGDWNQNHRDWNRREWNNNRYYGPSYNYRRDDGGDVAGALVLGAITGALLGQATSNNYTYAAPPTYYSAPPAYYNPPATYYNPGYGYYYGN